MSIYFGTTECPLKADGYMFKGNITLPLNKTFNGNVTFLLANGKKKTTEVVEAVSYTHLGVIEGKALPVIEIAPIQGFYDYKNKYKAGSAVETCPADLPEEVSAQMRKYAEQVAEVIGLDTYSRSDFLLDENNHMYCLEANTLPGMTPTSLLPQEAAVIGINFNELCEKLICLLYTSRCV